jgi:hypothetical protein
LESFLPHLTALFDRQMGRIIMNDDLERMWQEVDVVCFFKDYFETFSSRKRENREELLPEKSA